MSSTIKKCPKCGYLPPSGSTSKYCDIDTALLRFFCNVCRDYSDLHTCSLCADRVVYENRVRDAIRANNLEQAIHCSNALVAKFPKRPEYGNQQRLLLLAKERLEACSRIAALPMETSAQVQQAREILQQAASALKNADILEPIALARWRERVEEAVDELRGMERIKQQMIRAVGRALVAALLFALAWSVGHMLGAFAGLRVAPGESPYAAYLWMRTGIMFVAIGVLTAVVARRAWEIPGPLVAMIMLAVFGLVFILLGAVGGFWPGLVLLTIVAGTLTWLFEAGLAGGTDKKDPLRAPLAAISTDIATHMSGSAKAWVIGIVVVICLAAPSVHVPSDAVEDSDFGDIAALPGKIATASASVSSPVPSSVPRLDISPPTTNASAEPTPEPTPEPTAVVDSSSVDPFGDPPPGATTAPPPTSQSEAVMSIVIESATPDQPMENDTLEIQLGTLNDSTGVPYEYRTADAADWNPLSGNVLRLESLAAGDLNLEVRLVSQPSALPLTRHWKVLKLADIPLEVTLQQVGPQEPYVADKLVIQAACKRPSPNLVYKFRVPPDKTWTDSRDGSFQVDVVPKGTLKLQYGVVDSAVGDHSQVYEASWRVEQPRYSVEALEFVTGTMTATISDARLNVQHVAAKGDQFDGFVVRLIKLGERELVASNDEGDQITIPILDGAVELFNQARTTARQSSRSNDIAEREAIERARREALKGIRGR